MEGNEPAPAPPPANTNAGGLRDTGGLLVIACVFAVVGGYLDAYSYLAHGNVFANAQTGNVIFLAVYASAGRWREAARHVPPIGAFALGVAAAKWLGVRAQKREFRATLLCQTCEIAILSGLAVFAEHLPNTGVVPVISFVAALQNTSFSTIGPWSFNSTMTTGNLRSAVSGLVLWLAGRDAEANRAKAVALGAVCGSFLLGAVAGGSYTRWDQGHALVPCVALVGLGSLLTWQERRRRLKARL